VHRRSKRRGHDFHLLIPDRETNLGQARRPRRVGEWQSSSSTSERGASAVEYWLLMFAIAAVIALVVFAFGHVVRDTYQATCDKVAIASGSTQACS
jgi:pilus assembly protein Flp/PilA